MKEKAVTKTDHISGLKVRGSVWFWYWTVNRNYGLFSGNHWKKSLRALLVYKSTLDVICCYLFFYFYACDGSIFFAKYLENARACSYFLSLVLFSLKLFWEGFCARGNSRVAKFSHSHALHSFERQTWKRATSWRVAWAGIPASLPSVTYVRQNSPYMGFASAGKRSQRGHVFNVNLKPHRVSQKWTTQTVELFSTLYLNIKKLYINKTNRNTGLDQPDSQHQ